MAKGDGASLGVDLLEVEAELVGAPQALGCECLVDLKNVDIVLADSSLLKDLGDGCPWADTHEEGVDTSHRGGDELSNDGLTESDGGGTLHEQDGGGTVRDLRGVAGVDGTVLCEGGLDLAEGLGSHAGAHTVVLGDGDALLLAGLGVLEVDLKGPDLLVKQTSLLGSLGLLVGGSGKCVLVHTGNAAVLGHVLGENAHGDLAVVGLLVGLEEVGELRDGVWPVVVGHGLDTSADTNLDDSGVDGSGDVDAGLQAGGALSVGGPDGGGDGEASDEGGGTELGGSSAGSEDVSDGDILDEGRVDSRLLDQALEHACEEVGGGGVLEGTTATLGEGSAEGSGHYNLWRGVLVRIDYTV